MTTRVKISIVQLYMPVVVETLRSDGTVQHTQILTTMESDAREYVHSGQTLRIREMTTEEMSQLWRRGDD